MSDHDSPSGTSWILKIFWILLVITTVEVVLGIIKPTILLTSVAGTSVLNLIFIGLTLVKAAYIVQYFMHLKYDFQINFKDSLFKVELTYCKFYKCKKA